MSAKLSLLSCIDVIFVDLMQPGCDNLLHSTDCYLATPLNAQNFFFFFNQGVVSFLKCVAL